MTVIPTGTHEVKSTLVDDGFTPDHAQRKDSPIFNATKRLLHGARCWISGHKDTVEQHHCFIEWSLANGVDWQKVKDIATGKITELQVLDPHTDQPTGEVAPVKGFMIYWILEWTKFRGFDWEAFDPTKPETFVDSPQNMAPIAKIFHTGKRGVHRHSFPFWLFWAWPRLPGFVYTADEE